MAAQTAITRVESFPFDSKADGYDADGYPVYDRAVGAMLLRSVFQKYFSDGVFGEPAGALQIGKADSGLAVTVNPGIFIIRGAMGGWETGGDPVTIALTDSPPQGNTAFGIMLRYDENDTSETGRSLSIRVVAGDAASDPQPPEPDKSTPGVLEYRLGYVTVPSGAEDMSGATVTNEKGTGMCPYAAPFEKIDLSAVVDDAKDQAITALTQLLAYFETYRDAIDAALSDEEATHLQQQITAIQETIDSFGIDLAEEVDGESIEYSSDNIVNPKKLRIKDGGVATEKIPDGAVTGQKIAAAAFTDSKDASGGVAQRVAATPACVDAKIDAAVVAPRGYSYSKDTFNRISNGASADLSGGTVTGFVVSGSELTCGIGMVLIIQFSCSRENASYGNIRVLVNGNEEFKTHLSGTAKSMYTVAIAVDAGDKVSFNCEGYAANGVNFSHLSIQGV